MAGVWLQICGLPPQTTRDEVSLLTRNRAITIEIHDVRTVEGAGRFLVDTMETAKEVLQRTNYVLHRGSLVKIGLGAEDLKRCHLVTVKNFNSRAVTEKKLYMYSKTHGAVCNVSVDNGQARVWFFESSEAQSFISGLERSSLCVGEPVVQLETLDPLTASSQPMGVIVLDDDSDKDMDVDPFPVPCLSVEPVVASHRRVARKSLGPKSAKISKRVSSSSTEPSPSGNSGLVSDAAATPSDSAPASRFVTKSSTRPAARLVRGRAWLAAKAANDSGHLATPPTNGSTSPSTPNSTPRSAPSSMLNMNHWQSKVPFIYEYLYCQTSSTFTEEPDRNMEHILSVAWSKSTEPGLMCLYSSLGNGQASGTIRNWSMGYGKPRDDSSLADSKAVITKSQFAMPPRGSSSTNGASTLAAFNGLPAGITHTIPARDASVDDNVYNHTVTGLKIHNRGDIMFGNGLRALLVFDANNLKRKGTLALLDNMDGVYDVGRNYVVSNSYYGNIGVWKSDDGLCNYKWRYNDLRIFRGATPWQTSEKVRITALRVASNDSGVYAGDSGKGLSLCDFRERYIEKRSSPHTGVISSIENAGDNRLLVGTFEGSLSLLDTRFMSECRTSVVSSYATGVTGAGIGGIRMCPHNNNVFACSVGSDVILFYTEKPPNKDSLLFSHHAHRTLVTDFGWHPSRNSIYTIGSVDIGNKHCPGELQIWRPTDEIMY
ncbi:hypothetical protein GGI20_001364 [Coemansia sp. BCRC 34301]|nr:hypothetical protein GGI20_001364 [Coemansia sp. BCRC 34301]